MFVLKRQILFIILIFLLVLTLNGEKIFISINGSDNYSGSKKEPLYSLSKAMHLVSKIDSKAEIEIIFLPGEYRLVKGIKINNSNKTILIKPEIPNSVILSGAIKLVNPKRSSLSNMNDQIIEFNLNEYEIVNQGKFKLNGFASGKSPKREFKIRELFLNDKPLPLSSWPDGDFVKFDKLFYSKNGETGIHFENSRLGK